MLFLPGTKRISNQVSYLGSRAAWEASGRELFGVGSSSPAGKSLLIS